MSGPVTDPYPPRNACDICRRVVCIGLCARAVRLRLAGWTPEPDRKADEA